jgi:hypothetical protein
MFSGIGAAKGFSAALFLFLTAGCASLPFTDRAATARHIADERDWIGLVLPGPDFPLQAYLARPRPARTLTVYLEGDGLAWRSRYVPSADPTPRDPIGLRLAVADPSLAIAYLARPCQYVHSPRCRVEVWTSHRFSPEATAATSRAIDQLKARFSAERVLLAGYSGGGVLAALVAAGRSDVAGLITIAAPLDVGEWTRHHDVDPLSGSLDPAHCCGPSLSRLVQRHVVGFRDKVTPRSVVDSYHRSLSGEVPSSILGVDSDHECCYVSFWPGLVPRLRHSILGREDL